mmetsp:Transcript_41785/g.120710  ORF Transcript_41785/g.120710 Transcript_41785/m.120710 type:complete len:307 (-) Transcript_41785:82-1002(-)
MSPPRSGKVTVCFETDALLNPAGKKCHPMGLPNLPGGLSRCHSMPNAVLSCPGGWLEHDRQRQAARSSEHQERQRETMRMRHTVGSGAWAEASTHLRSSSASSRLGLPGGGATQGPKVMRPHSNSAEYDPAKHGWYHPAGQAELARLRDQRQPGSWASVMFKARDHGGYGDDGLVDYRDVQVTAVSGDAPAWFTGTRTLPGPRSTKAVPVRRCPFVQIEGKNVKVQARTYKMGDAMCTLETFHDRSAPPTPVPVIRAPRHDDMENKAKRCNLEFGGCQTRPVVLPSSNHVTHEAFQPPRMRSMARR